MSDRPEGFKATIIPEDPLPSPGNGNIPPWFPEHPEHDKPEFTFENGDPDWRGRIQNCIDEYGRVHFNRVFEIVLRLDRQAIIVRNDVRMTGLGHHTGIVLQDGNELANSGVVDNLTLVRVNNALGGDRADGFYATGFLLDCGNQENHKVTLKQLSVIGSKAMVEDVLFRRMRAGENKECWAARCADTDQNVDKAQGTNDWWRSIEENHSWIRRCHFEEPLSNFDRGPGNNPNWSPEITCAFADRLELNTFNVPKDEGQTAGVHCCHPQAYDHTISRFNHNSAPGVTAINWTQQPHVHVQRNQEIHNNTGV